MTSTLSKKAGDSLCDVFAAAARYCMETNEDIVQMTLVESETGKPVQGIAIIGIGPHAIATLKLAVKLIDRARGRKAKVPQRKGGKRS